MQFKDLFAADGIFLKTENYILRRISADEKPYYEKMAQTEHPDFLQTSADALAWDELLSEDHLTCSILKRETEAFCGFCQLQWIFSDIPELGIDLLTEFRKTGLAAEVLPPFMTQAKHLLKNKYFYSKIKKNNLPSQKLAEKIGGKYIGTKSLLPKDFPKEMAAFAEKEFPDFFYLEYYFMK